MIGWSWLKQIKKEEREYNTWRRKYNSNQKQEFTTNFMCIWIMCLVFEKHLRRKYLGWERVCMKRKRKNANTQRMYALRIMCACHHTFWTTIFSLIFQKHLLWLSFSHLLYYEDTHDISIMWILAEQKTIFNENSLRETEI